MSSWVSDSSFEEVLLFFVNCFCVCLRSVAQLSPARAKKLVWDCYEKGQLVFWCLYVSVWHHGVFRGERGVCVCVCVCVSRWKKKVPGEWQTWQVIPAILQVSSSKHTAKKNTWGRGPFHQSITAILTEERREEKQFTKPTHVASTCFGTQIETGVDSKDDSGSQGQYRE